jgi:UDP-N-acetylglucosamine 2-epimerase (hydrolysing)
LKKKILFITGTRADFGKLKPLIRQIQNSDHFEYAIFATGMHMLAKYGSTFIEIQKSGFSNNYPYINQDGALNNPMDIVLANTIQGLAHYIREHPVDMIVVHGDRIEAMAGAVVGSLGNTLVAHIEGGEVSGTIDELLRHSISKLSHLHFVSNDEAKQRLIQMGEIPNTVYIIGSPDIDVMLSDDLPMLNEVLTYYEIPFTEYAIFTYHPVTTELPLLRDHIRQVIIAIRESELNYVVIYPNSDTGAEIILEELEELKGDARFRFLPSMRFEYYLSLLKNARMIVGNSSAGIREAPVYGVPTINIGTRQMNRFKYVSILDVPEDKEKILLTIKSCPSVFPTTLHFGSGMSAKLFLEILETGDIWATPRQKLFCDL